MQYKVLTKMLYGWESVWNDDRFETFELAKKEIEDHVKTCHENNMECSLNDFKIINNRR